jgi:uncharacterized protein (TIGR03083 family)
VETDEHIDALENEGERLLEAAQQAGLDAQVPSCPAWRVRDLLAHIGYVHRWAARYVSEGLAEMVPKLKEKGVLSAAPSGEEIFTWARRGHQDLLRALQEAPSELECWTFLPAPSPLGHWARRQAHETAVHRADAELAAGQSPGPFDPAFAADGVDELLFGFLSRSRNRPREAEPVLGRMSLRATDLDQIWTVEVLEGHLVPGKGGGPTEADLTVKGTASQLYLLAWNRQPGAALSIQGRQELLDFWRERVQVTWS